MKLHKIIGLSVVFCGLLGLVGCAPMPNSNPSPNTSTVNTQRPTAAQQLAQGKANFQQKNYSQAFAQLMPLAKQGNAEAQYAVGYMYYYGKGVAQNQQRAINWMQKAAANGQKAAAQALKAIQG